MDGTSNPVYVGSSPTGGTRLGIYDEVYKGMPWPKIPKLGRMEHMGIIPKYPVPQVPSNVNPKDNIVFKSGAVRSNELSGTTKPCRYDLISPIALRRIAETYGEGALKYGDRNWEKGIPYQNLMNHAIAHINSYQAGDKTEDHLAHAVWNLMAIMHFQEIRISDDDEEDD